MTPEELVRSFYSHKQHLLNTYTDTSDNGYVNSLIRELGLDEEKMMVLEKILDSVLTDAHYSILLGIDGEANIGGTQHLYKLSDENGNELTGSGEIEVYAYQYFHDQR